MKASAVSTITKSLPIGFPTLVNYSLLATLGYINLFIIKLSTGLRIKMSFKSKRIFFFIFRNF